jgi:hypothetical protein
MEPKDLKNPDGLKSTQNAESESAGKTAASNENIKDKKKAGKAKQKKNELAEEKSGIPESTDSPEFTSPDSSDNIETEIASPSGDLAGEVKTQDEIPGEIAEGEEFTEEQKPTEAETGKDKKADKQTIKTIDPELDLPGEMKEPVDEVARKNEKPEDEIQPKEHSDTEVKTEDVKDEKTDEAKTREPKVVEKSGTVDVAPSPPKVKSKVQKEKITEQTVSGKDKPDYSTYSHIELVNALREVIDSNGDHDIKEDVEAIRAAFYSLVKNEIEEQKKDFIESGGNEEEFTGEENPYEQDIKDLLKRYRQLRHEFNKKLEQEKEINLQLKYDIIEEIKGLIHKEESINKTFQDFRDLQQRWREIGLVPQAKMKDLWDTYHFHVENFYDYIKINQELRDLDLKKNLEMKIRLCEQAEELLLETNILRAFNNLQKLHERWREIGPVPRENKDDIWERFKASTAKINKKHQEYFEDRKSEQKKNLDAKRALCEQVEEINEMELATHKEWGEKSKEVVNLQKIWRTIGFAPRKDNNKIYKRFREACDKFFDAKRDFYSKNKELQQNNLQMKIDLCIQAEALKNSDDWRKTTQELINIQKQWKEIGPVPRKHSDALWKRFRASCDHFFEKKSEHFSGIDSEQVDNLKEKEQLIQEVENFKSTGDPDENLKVLKDFQRRWTEIGHVPIRKKDDIQKKFRGAINKLFDDLNINESKRNLLKFRTKMASFSESSRGQGKIRLERDKYMTKLKQLENDLILLDNNIGFFAKSKNAETLIKDVRLKIEQTKEKIEFLKDKIRVIDEMDQSEE